jgi:hypothetical protein
MSKVIESVPCPPVSFPSPARIQVNVYGSAPPEAVTVNVFPVEPQNGV